MSKIEVNAIEPQCGTTLTVGASGDTITFPTGTTVVNNGSQTGFGRTGTVDWDTTAKTASFTAVSGVGYFVNTTSGAITVTLPAGSAGSIVAISDYANTAATNKITIDPNGTDKINGINLDSEITTNGASVTLLYIDSTRGWKDITDATLDVTGINPFVSATGGTILTCGDYKIHTFTGPGTFTVTSAGNPTGSTTVDYLVVAGGGGGGGGAVPSSLGSGAGGAGGFRESSGAASGSYTTSPLGVGVAALPVAATSYTITVGGGGSGGSSADPSGNPGSDGNNSVFSTITSTGGGGGGGRGPISPNGRPGGSGGGSAYNGTGGSGNTPPVSPSQGNNGGSVPSTTGQWGGAGGGGATGTGTPGTCNAGPGGAGATTSINGTPTARAGGGGGGGSTCQPSLDGGLGGTGGGGGGSPTTGSATAGTTNLGGGGGGAASNNNGSGAQGGSGIVIIRYKFQ